MAAPAPLAVSGGSHGTAASLEALDALAAGLTESAGSLALAATSVAGVGSSPDLLLSAVLDPRGGAEAVALTQACAVRLAGLGGGLAETSAAVAGAVAAYRAWDVGTAAGAEALKIAVGGVAVRASLPVAVGAGATTSGWWVVSWATGEVFRARALATGASGESAEAVGDGAQEAMWDLGVDAAGAAAAQAWDAVGPYQDEVADVGVHAVLGVLPSTPLVAALAARGLYDQPVTATARAWGAPQVGAAPVAGVAGLVAHAGALKERSAGVAGAVDVARTPGGPGSPARVVVYLPATQEGVRPGGRNPADMETNLLAIAGEATAVTDGTIAAMRAAGVQPGDQVAFVGFSQGGLSALQLAADPRVRAMCTPRAVVTAGSPTAIQQAPDGVQVLSLEHDGDPFPTLEGAANPDLPNWVTVRAEPGGTPHDADAYARTGALVDASDDPSLIDATAALEPFLAMDETTTVSRSQLRRPGGEP